MLLCWTTLFVLCSYHLSQLSVHNCVIFFTWRHPPVTAFHTPHSPERPLELKVAGLVVLQIKRSYKRIQSNLSAAQSLLWLYMHFKTCLMNILCESPEGESFDISKAIRQWPLVYSQLPVREKERKNGAPFFFLHCHKKIIFKYLFFPSWLLEGLSNVQLLVWMTSAWACEKGSGQRLFANQSLCFNLRAVTCWQGFTAAAQLRLCQQSRQVVNHTEIYKTDF